MFSDNYQQQTAIGSAQRILDASLTDHELAQLAHSDEARVRAAVAERVDAPLTTLVRLASDVSPAVRAGVARNQRVDLPIELREDLARDKSYEVVVALIQNPSLPIGMVRKLARSRNREVAQVARKRLSTGEGTTLQRLGMYGTATN